jgi:hypothetical protein
VVNITRNEWILVFVIGGGAILSLFLNYELSRIPAEVPNDTLKVDINYTQLVDGFDPNNMVPTIKIPLPINSRTMTNEELGIGYGN